MKLTYRGVSYDYNPPAVEFSSSNTVGKYRGLDVRFRNPVKIPVLQPTLDLVYRGVAYISNPAPQVEAEPVAPVEAAPVASAVAAAPLNLEDKARSMMMGHHRSVKRRQQSMLSRLDAEVGLQTRDAETYWNHIQGKIHPSFWATYDRSHAALS
jgi:Domain of unknown function (DUF4278)